MVKETEDPNLPDFVNLLKSHPAVSLGNHVIPPLKIWFKYDSQKVPIVEQNSLGERCLRIVLVEGCDSNHQLRALAKEFPGIRKAGQRASFYGYSLSLEWALTSLDSSVLAQSKNNPADPLYYELTTIPRLSHVGDREASAKVHLSLIRLGFKIAG